MNTATQLAAHNPSRRGGSIAVGSRLPQITRLFLALVFCATSLHGADPVGSGVTYMRDQIKEVPWSIHVVKVDRKRTDLQLITSMGGGTSIGMGLVSEQVKLLPPEFGRPLAAINGDFYKTVRKYQGDPEGLQIVRGELISAPAPSRSCFWIDKDGKAFLTNVMPNFHATLPDQARIRFGLNEERDDHAVLYTAAVGKSTRTSGGIELVLEREDADAPWLPLHVSRSYNARVRQVNKSGDTPIAVGTAVLSLPSSLGKSVATLAPGSIIKLSTATIPDLAGAQTGMGGGPALVRGGKVVPFKGAQPRHPRSAFGWSVSHFFLVEVDGRQSISAGMTFNELAAYFVKMGCTDALNLDGGGSATMWIYGSVINSPSEGKERPSANALVVVQDKSARPITATK